MWITLGIIIIIVGCTVVFFHIPYSKSNQEFKLLSERISKKSNNVTDVFTETDIAKLPQPVRKYFRYCGYIGTNKMTYMKIMYHDVTFRMGINKPTLSIDYTQINTVEKPERIAFIDSSMFAIPFEGLDTYINGKGAMKGVIAKVFTLFNQKGIDMDKSSLVTCLSECLLIPNLALQDFIQWEEIDDFHAKATMTYYGISVSGVFAFNSKGEMVSFTTNDRGVTVADGSSTNVKWSALCSDYQKNNGVVLPTTLQAVWHYEDGDFIYFDGKDIKIEYK